MVWCCLGLVPGDRCFLGPGSGTGGVRSHVICPAGLDLVPEETPARDGGVLVQRVEPDGVAGRDGRLRVGDRITQVNGHSLAGCNLHR